MDKEKLEEFIKDTNRSLYQTKFLLELLDEDFQKLVDLEERIENLHLHYCPGDREACEEVLKMELSEDKKWFSLDQWRVD